MITKPRYIYRPQVGTECAVCGHVVEEDENHFHESKERIPVAVVDHPNPTREDVEHLKANWHDDPTWDLEETAGFEAYHDELYDYRLKCEAEWKAQHRKMIFEYAERLNLEGNMDLAEHLWELSSKLAQAENDLEDAQKDIRNLQIAYDELRHEVDRKENKQ